MANAITVNTYSSLSQSLNGKAPALPAVPVVINVNKIISITTRTNTALPLGISSVTYEVPINESSTQVELICIETRAALLALINGPLV